MKNPRIAGIIVIVIGAIFMLMNFNMIELGRGWWALFLLIPIIPLASVAWEKWKRNGEKFSPDMTGPLIGLMSISTVMVISLFNISWGSAWPVFIIIGGVSVLLGGKK